MFSKQINALYRKVFLIIFTFLYVVVFFKDSPVYTFKEGYLSSNIGFNNIFNNINKRTDEEKFKQWEKEINDKRSKELYSDAYTYCKKMEEAAVKANFEYWTYVSYYYYGIIAKSQNNYKVALTYFNQIINKGSAAFKYEEERIFKLYFNTAEIYKKLNDYPKAIIYYKSCLELKDKLKSKQFLVSAYVNLGGVYSSQSMFAEARECYLNGLLVNGNADYIASTIFNNLGNDEFNQGNYSKAIAYYINSIEISEKNNDLDRLALTYNNIGSIYTKELSDFKKAIAYFTKSLEIEKKKGNNEGIATELNNIGNALTYQLKFKEAEKTFEEALQIFKKIENLEGIAKTFEYLGSLYSKSGKYNKAIEDFTKCIDIRKKNNDEINLTDAYNNLGSVYYALKEYNKALQYYSKCLEISKIKKDKSMIKRIYSGLHEIYAGLGQYDKAYQYLQYYSDLKDTLLNENISKQIIDIQEKYEKGKMEQKVAMQNLEIKNKSLQRNGVLVFLILSIIVFSGALYMIFQKRKNERLLYEKNSKIKDQEIKNLVQHSEIKSMVSMAEGQEQERQRISRELHDRIGSLLSLIKLNLSNAEGGNKQVIKENLALLDNTYQEVRNISHNLHSGLLTHFGLKAALNDLKKTVETHGVIRFNLLFHEKELTLPKETESVIFKVLQELVTNALKHAEAKNLDIQINDAEDGIISITIEDDGKGFDTSSLKNKEGIGLKNVRYRIESIGGSLDISSSPGKGSCFILNIPAPEMAVKKVLS